MGELEGHPARRILGARGAVGRRGGSVGRKAGIWLRRRAHLRLQLLVGVVSIMGWCGREVAAGHEDKGRVSECVQRDG